MLAWPVLQTKLAMMWLLQFKPQKKSVWSYLNSYWKIGQIHNTSHDPLRNYINKYLQNYLSENPPSLKIQSGTNNTNLAIADSSSIGNHLISETPFLNVNSTTTGLAVILPDNTTISITHADILDLLTLPTNAKIAHMFPTLNKSLLSISSICNVGDTDKFTAKEATIHVDRKIVLQVPKDSIGL